MSDPDVRDGGLDGSGAHSEPHAGKPDDSDGGSDSASQKASPLSRPHVWTATSYFAEGFPYSVVNNLADVLFTEAKASLQAIGMTSLFHLPWNLKVLWGPFLDEYATKRAWLVWLEIALTVALIGLAATVSVDTTLAAVSVAFFLLAMLSATHDVAIDGLYLEALDEKDQARFVGVRAPAYRLGMFAVTSPLLILIGFAGWTVGFLAAAVVMALLLAYHAFFLPRVEQEKRPIRELIAQVLRLRFFLAGTVLVALLLLVRWLFSSSAVARLLDSAAAALPTVTKLVRDVGLAGAIPLALLALLVVGLLVRRRLKRREGASSSFYGAAFFDFFEQPKVAAILAFVIAWRAGESFLMKMKYPFLKTLGMTLEQYGIANGTIGMIAGLAAPAVGGWLIAKHGLGRWVWPFALAQNGLNFLYVFVAASATSILALEEGARFALLTVVVAAESFGAGLGTAVFMVYLMRCCRPQYRAAHMALLTALMSVSFTVAGMASGFLADAIGFTAYFVVTFVASVPGMALLLFIPYLDGSSAQKDAESSMPAQDG